jgi:hypothetical protein
VEWRARFKREHACSSVVTARGSVRIIHRAVLVTTSCCARQSTCAQRLRWRKHSAPEAANEQHCCTQPGGRCRCCWNDQPRQRSNHNLYFYCWIDDPIVVLNNGIGLLVLVGMLRESAQAMMHPCHNAARSVHSTICTVSQANLHDCEKHSKVCRKVITVVAVNSVFTGTP